MKLKLAEVWGDVMVQYTKPVLMELESHMDAGSSPSCSTSDLDPCLQPGKAVKNGKFLSPWFYTGDSNKFLASGFRLPQLQLLVTILGVNQRREDFSYSLSLTLSFK